MIEQMPTVRGPLRTHRPSRSRFILNSMGLIGQP
jgi:hypothetical protein